MAEKSENKDTRTGLEIAVIGMSGRFPGAESIHEFWENLKNGVESISFFSDQELEESGIKPENPGGPNFVRAKGIIKNVEYLDASFFDYTPPEAEIMDPQMRVFHECSWEALEDAGYAPESYNGRIGVYGGGSTSYYWLALSRFSKTSALMGNIASVTLYNKDFLCKRLSYNFNLIGPSFSLYTACSTSLVAIDLACKGLLTGQCDIALAGGVSIKDPRKIGYRYEEGMIVSPDGHNRTFDRNAKGTVFGNGAGVVVLKPLEEAEADGDSIYAVIKSSAVNNDGINKSNFAAPGLEGQVDVIRAALHIAEVESESIGYIEAHGTATELGDPIEIEGLNRAFNTDKRGFCAIGSVKSNMGHLDCAAGVTGFIKVALALNHKLIPPSLHFESPNPGIDFENSPFYVNTELKEWNNDQYPLRAGVSSFGIGGTNAHLILEEAPAASKSVNQWVSESASQCVNGQPTDGRGGSLCPPLKSRNHQLIILSAKTPTALDKMTKNLAEYFKNSLLNHGNHENPVNPGLNLADAAYTLQVGRTAFDRRRYIVCATIDKAIAALTSPGSTAVNVNTVFAKDDDKPVIFMFPGQGAQYVNMGLELYETEGVFRREMDRCFEILKGLLDYNIKEILYPSSMSYKSYLSDINQTEIAQPLIFVIEYALAKLLIKWGINPQGMIGHSIGEYTAACISGVLSLEDALTIVVLRGKLMQQMPKGSMLGVFLSEAQLRPLLIEEEEISVSAVNAPALCTVSGPHDAITAFEERLNQKGYETRRLHTSHAFHSRMMDPILAEFEKKVREITLNEPDIPFISNVTGTWAAAREVTDPGYWAAHIRKTVRFLDGLEELFKEEGHEAIFIEVGPGKVLTTLARQYAKHANKKKPKECKMINLVRHPQETVQDDTYAYLLDKIGQLWLNGKKIDWKEFYWEEKRRRIFLPPYPFERRRYWLDNDSFPVGAEGWGNLDQSFSQKRKDIADWFYIPSWKRSRLPLFKANQEGLAGCCLVFTDQNGFGSRLKERLEQEGAEVVIVKTGTTFNGENRENHQVYTINPREDSDYDALMDALGGQGKVPRYIVHLWNVTADDTVELEPGAIDKAQDIGFYSLLNLARAIGKQDIEDKIGITVLSDNMQEVLGEAIMAPHKATLLGAVMVIPKEYPNIRCGSIDIVKPEPGTREEKSLIDQLLAEMSSAAPENIVAYRSNIRWVRAYEPLRLEKPGQETQRLKEKGVYLITGGLGGIGLVLAEYLARHVNAKLVLTGRSPFPLPGDWDKWLHTHPPDDSISRKIWQVRELEKLGAEVLVLSSDVSNRQHMEAAIEAAEQKFGRINGVIHSAGLPDAGMIPLRTRETSERVFASKVKGTLILDRILKGRGLDFFLLCSSISAVHPPIGQVGYTAANAFLDAFSHHKNAREGTPMISINWDVWQEVGMAVNAVKQFEGVLDVSLKSGILPAEGQEVFRRALEEPLPQVVTSTRNLLHMIESSLLSTRWDSQAVLEKDAPSRPKQQRPNLVTPYSAPGSELEKTLAELWKDILGIDNVGIDDNFFDLGATSLDMIQVNSKLKKIMDKNIPLVILYNHPTVIDLAQYLSKEYADKEVTEAEKIQLEAISKGKSKLRQKGKRIKGETNA